MATATSSSTHSPGRNRNALVARRLREAAELLELQGASGFRIAAYRRAAERVEGTTTDLMDLARDEGVTALIRIPDIGKGIASAILERNASARW